MKKPLVVYIIGQNRSGSTLLDYILSCHPQALSVGELHHLGDYVNKKGVGKRTGWKCSCGEVIEKCEFWSFILSEIPLTREYKTNLKPTNEINIIEKLRVNKIVSEEITLNKKEGKNFAENTWSIYNIIFKQTGKKILIDSSKNPLEAFYLMKHAQGNIKFLFLKRDIWEIAYSRMMRLAGYSDEFLESMSFQKESIYKSITHTYLSRKKNEIFSKKINLSNNDQNFLKTIEYNYLTKNLVTTINEICDFLEINKFTPPLMTNQNKDIIHTIHGSPSRSKEKKIKPDGRWKKYYRKRPMALIFGRMLQSI